MLASIQVKGVVEAPPYLITADLHKDVLWITQLKKKRSIWQSHLFRHKALEESYLTGFSAPIRPCQDVQGEPWHHFSKRRVWTFTSSSSKHLSSYAQCLWLLLLQTLTFSWRSLALWTSTEVPCKQLISNKKINWLYGYLEIIVSLLFHFLIVTHISWGQMQRECLHLGASTCSVFSLLIADFFPD